MIDLSENIQVTEPIGILDKKLNCNKDCKKEGRKMKQKRLVSMIGALVVIISAVVLITGCPTGQEPKNEQEEQWKPGEKAFFDITYDLTDCTYNGSESYNNWQLKKQTIKAGAEIILAQDGSESSSGGEWKLEYVKHKDGKYIKGWSKNKAGNTKDYDFGQKIKPTDDMTLYPAVSKYGIGDVIDGKTIIYVRNGIKDKIQTKFLGNGEYTEYNVVGTNWRYIAADVDAGKNSEKKQWSSSAKNIITSNGIGGGKENTEKILAGYATDTVANNAAKYCQSISPNGYLPSEAEAFLIFHAIRNKKITGLPTFSQTTNIGGSFSGKTAYFWTSTQSDTSKAYVINLVKDELLYSGKGEEAKTNVKGFVCPIVYYDDEGKVVK